MEQQTFTELNEPDWNMREWRRYINGLSKCPRRTISFSKGFQFLTEVLGFLSCGMFGFTSTSFSRHTWEFPRSKFVVNVRSLHFKNSKILSRFYFLCKTHACNDDESEIKVKGYFTSFAFSMGINFKEEYSQLVINKFFSKKNFCLVV